MQDWKTCTHRWKPKAKVSGFGVVFQDECTKCGSIGVMADKPDDHGYYAIVPQPWATIIDFNEFKKRKEAQHVKENSISREGNFEGEEEFFSS